MNVMCVRYINKIQYVAGLFVDQKAVGPESSPWSSPVQSPGIVETPMECYSLLFPSLFFNILYSIALYYGQGEDCESYIKDSYFDCCYQYWLY